MKNAKRHQERHQKKKTKTKSSIGSRPAADRDDVFTEFYRVFLSAPMGRGRASFDSIGRRGVAGESSCGANLSLFFLLRSLLLG